MTISKERLEELRQAAAYMEERYGIKNATIRMTTEEFLEIYKLIDFSKLS